MTTTRTPKNADARTETLAEFGAALNAHAGEDVQFPATVRRLYVTRTKLAHLKSARDAIFKHVKVAYERGVTDYRIGQDTFVLRKTDPRPGDLTATVSSAAAKKASRAAWEKAHVFAPFVQVKAPRAVDLAISLPEVPENAFDQFIAAPDAVELYTEHPSWTLAKELRDVEAASLAHLRAVAAMFGWPGDLKVFADGWSAQLTRRQYSSDALAATDPGLFDQLAEFKQKQAAPRVYIVKLDPDGGGEDAADYCVD